MKHWAMVSVWDKRGIEEFAKVLCEVGYDILATGGTASAIRAAGVAVTEIAEYTGFPELLGGRVKTLHPKIAGGILATGSCPGLEPIRIVVCNLYPFGDGLKRGLSLSEMIELIDIGGVTLLRAAAKNHEFVTVVPAPEYYPLVADELRSKGEVGIELRRRLATQVFELTCDYDATIARYLKAVIQRHDR